MDPTRKNHYGGLHHHSGGGLQTTTVVAMRFTTPMMISHFSAREISKFNVMAAKSCIYIFASLTSGARLGMGPLLRSPRGDVRDLFSTGRVGRCGRADVSRVPWILVEGRRLTNLAQ